MKTFAARSLPVAFISLVIVLASLAPLLAGCSKNKRQDTIRTSLIAVNAARDGFSEWDRTHQLEIVEAATSRDEGAQKLALYRAKREAVINLFEAGYRWLATAATGDDEASLKEALKQIAALLKAIETLKGGV